MDKVHETSKNYGIHVQVEANQSFPFAIQTYSLKTKRMGSECAAIAVNDEEGEWCSRWEAEAKLKELLNEQKEFWINVSKDIVDEAAKEAREEAVLLFRLRASLLLLISLLVMGIMLLLYGFGGVYGMYGICGIYSIYGLAGICGYFQ